MITRAASAVLLVLCQSALAQSAATTREALDTIASFADRLCQTIPIDGASSGLELSGRAKADLAGLVKKIADFGIEGAAKYNNDYYQNVLQKDLAETLKQSRDCRLQVWNDLKQSFQIGQPSTPKACRDKSHGIERYGREFDITRSSHWMGGGYSQDPWCNDVIGQLRGEHPDGAFNKVSSSERSNNTCPPFNCPQYQYICTIHVKTDPVYIEKASGACR